MYNFNFIEDEKLIDVFEDVFIKQDNKEKITTIALTDRRLLFLDYINYNEGLEVLRVTKVVKYLRYKDVYYQINLCDIKDVIENEYYSVILKDETMFSFNNDKLYTLLSNMLYRKRNNG